MDQFVQFQQTGKLGFGGNEITSSSNNVSILPNLTWNVTGPSGSGAPVYGETVSIQANFSPPTITLGLGYTLQFNLVSNHFTASIDPQGNFNVVSPGGVLLYQTANFEQVGGNVSFMETIDPATPIETVNWADTLTLQVVTDNKGLEVEGSSSFGFTYQVTEGGPSQVVHSVTTAHG